MLTHLRRSVIFALFCLAFFGFVYALAGTGVSQLFFGHQANGSVTANGSTLIGQNWSTSPMWFHGRPDDAGPYAAVVCSANEKNCTPSAGGDNPLVNNGVSGQSGASNLGPRSKTLLENTQQLVQFWHSMGVNPTPDLVTTSGSGYDPDITRQDAMVQIPMVSKARGIAPSALQALIDQQTHRAQLGFLGSSYINVLQLNEALAKLH
jgi:potassium-transporting ATPase KdpC subunit